MGLLSNRTFSEKICDESDWRCHGSFFLCGGYINVHQLYTNNPLTEIIPEQKTIHFTPQNAFPNNFSGVRVGFGTQLGTNTGFTYQMYYNQVFTKSRTYDDLEFSAASKVLLSVVQYTINPKSRIKVGMLGGAGVVSSYVTTSFVNLNRNISQTSNTVDIDPVIGGDIAYQINSKFALTFTGFWDFGTYNKDLTGRFVPAVMLVYFP